MQMAKLLLHLKLTEESQVDNNKTIMNLQKIASHQIPSPMIISSSRIIILKINIKNMLSSLEGSNSILQRTTSKGRPLRRTWKLLVPDFRTVLRDQTRLGNTFSLRNNCKECIKMTTYPISPLQTIARTLIKTQTIMLRSVKMQESP